MKSECFFDTRESCLQWNGFSKWPKALRDLGAATCLDQILRICYRDSIMYLNALQACWFFDAICLCKKLITLLKHFPNFKLSSMKTSFHSLAWCGWHWNSSIACRFSMCNFSDLVPEDEAVGFKMHVVSHGICCCHALPSSPSSGSWSTIFFASEIGFGFGISEILLAPIRCGEGNWINGISCVASSRHVAAINTIAPVSALHVGLAGSSTCCHYIPSQAMMTKQSKIVSSSSCNSCEQAAAAKDLINWFIMVK